MSNFKIGDTVRRVHTWGDFGGLPGGEVGIVSVLHGNDIVEIKGYGDWLHATENLELVEQIDDELPPAPDSVRYYNSYIVGHNDQHLILDGYNATHPGMNLMYLGIVPRTGSTSANKEIGINMDADAALQLAHDLRRMAMEIRRKERNG